jgi:glycosyltransferase involved in cell wall biosynthesis
LHPQPRVLLLSTVHPPNDPRIAGKIAPALATHYDVCWQPLPFFKYLVWRLLLVHPMALWQFIKIRPQIVHIFVAELLPLAFVFRCLGAKVVYEVQENLYKKMAFKTHNKGWLFQYFFRFFDHQARRFFYCVFTEKAYLNEYQNLAKPHAIIQNFADLTWTTLPLPNPNSPTFFYAGVISLERSLDTIINALALLKSTYPDLKMHLFGKLNLTQTQLEQLPHYAAVRQHLVFHGYVSQRVAFAHAQSAVAGIALLKPIGDYPDSYPTKLFDYMALGLPVVTSNFELYQQIVETQRCGFCIAPDNASQLAETLKWLIEHPEEARNQGKRGRTAVEAMYNWPNEAQKLLDFYQKLRPLQQ